MPDLIVFEFDKNSREKVRALLREWQGKRLLDLRVFYDTGSGDWRPTQKGVCLRVDLLPNLKEAIMALESALTAEAQP